MKRDFFRGAAAQHHGQLIAEFGARHQIAFFCRQLERMT